MHTKPIFTIDWEPWFCYKPCSDNWETWDEQTEEPTYYLLDLLRRHKVKGIWYCLGWLKERRKDLFEEIVKEGHVIGNHTYYHTYDTSEYCKEYLKSPLFRMPKFKGQKRLYSGGFWFRALPYSISKKLLEQSKCFFIHPHDVMLFHPILDNPIQNFKRQIGLTTVRDKLERLMREVEWE